MSDPTTVLRRLFGAENRYLVDEQQLLTPDDGSTGAVEELFDV